MKNAQCIQMNTLHITLPLQMEGLTQDSGLTQAQGPSTGGKRRKKASMKRFVFHHQADVYSNTPPTHAHPPPLGIVLVNCSYKGSKVS